MATKSSVHRKLQRSRDGDIPVMQKMTLVENGQSIQQTIMDEAISECNAQPGDRVNQIYMPDEEVVVIDLSGDS